MSLNQLTIEELSRGYAAGDFTAEEVVSEAYAAADSHDHLNALLDRPDPQALIDQARALDRRRHDGEELGALAGVPVVVKDNICTRDLRTTAGSRILEGFASPYDATVVERLREAGALIVGKGNLDEFAMGSSNENSAYGAVLNPVDTSRVPGGSSGGSAAAVAAHLCAAALGSDTGGSIRQPASLTGIVGLKPTYGRVSRFGLIAFASSLDQVGPLTRTVGDAALMLGAIAGHDPRDMTCSPEVLPELGPCLEQGVEGMRLGVPREYFSDEVGEGIDPQVVRAVKAAIDQLAEAGAEIVELSLPHTEHAVATYYLIATAEASSNLARYDGVRYGHRADAPADLTELYERSRAEGFGDEVKRRIMLGTYVLSAGFYDAYYRKAQQVRTLIRRDFEQAFDQVDAIITPTSPTPAWRLGEKADDLLGMYLADVYTVPANLAGLPGLSVPCGTTDEGLPVGLQVLGKPFDEATVLRVGAAWERLHDGGKRGHDDGGAR